MPKFHPWRPRLKTTAGLALLLAALLGAFHAWNNPEQTARLLTGQSASREGAPPTKLERQRDRTSDERRFAPPRDPDAWFAEVLARNPGLEPEWRPVPDQENGFLQWLTFSELHQVDGKLGSEDLGIPEDIDAMLNGRAEWNADRVERYLASQHEVLETATRIGLLTGQSTAGIDPSRWHFVGARFTKQCADLLLADARLAAEAGDADHALLRTRAAMGLATHYGQVETPSLLMATVGTLVRLQAINHAMDHLLPALQPGPADLAVWRETLRPPFTHGSETFATLLRGEAWVALRGLAIPLLNGSNDSLGERPELPDPDAFLDSFAQAYLAAAGKAGTATLADFSGSAVKSGWFPPPPAHLSAESRAIYGSLSIGPGAWARGWTRAGVISARTDAALALLQGAEIPVEPFTGQPFVHDPVARTLQAPDDPHLNKILEDDTPLELPW